MNELTDFEALIDLNEIFPRVEGNEETDKESSQEPLSDVLDKICETIDAESINIGLNAVHSDEKPNENVALDDTILNLDEFNEILNETRVLNENINNLESEEIQILNGNEEAEQKENNAAISPVAHLDDIADVVKNTACEFNDDNRKNEYITEKPDEKIINLDEFEEFFNNTVISNVNKDNLKNNETVVSDDAKNLKYLDFVTDFVGIASFVTSEGCDDKVACKNDTDEPNNKHNKKEGLDDTVINLDEFEEFFNNTVISNVNKDNLENNETKMSDDAKNVTYLDFVTDFVGIASSVTSEGCDDKVASKNDPDEPNNKHNNKEGLLDTVINLDEFEDVFNEKCAFKETLLSKKLAQFKENEDMATLEYSSVPKLVKMDDETKNTGTYKMIFNGIPVSPFTTNLEGKQNASKTADLSVSHNPNNDKPELKTILIEEDTEVISISSTEDDSDDGYNSDDFEFISESEAKKQGPLNLNGKEFTEGKLTYSDMKYHKTNYIRCTVAERTNRAPQSIPEGESYLDLFRGMYAPIVMNNLYYMTKKRVMPVKSMSVSDGFGFDIPEEREASPEHVAQAAESMKKIRFLYPEENRKRRRRF